MMGRSMSKAVSQGSWRRMGARNRFMMWLFCVNRKQKLVFSRTSLMRSGGMASFMPRASRTSAVPQLLVAARLPCFATLMPAAAQTKAAAVETLNVLDLSPPVPTISRMSSSSKNLSQWLRMPLAAPANSSMVAPFSARATRNAPIWMSVERPDMISSTAASAASKVRSCLFMRVMMESWIIVKVPPVDGPRAGHSRNLL